MEKESSSLGVPVVVQHLKKREREREISRDCPLRWWGLAGPKFIGRPAGWTLRLDWMLQS